MVDPAMTRFLSALIVWSTAGDADAAAFELGVERAGGLDRGPGCAWRACQRGGGSADCRAGDRIHQRDHRVCAQDRYLSSNAGDSRAILVRDQCADGGTGFGGSAGISGARIHRGICGRDCVEPGESAAEGDGDASEGPSLIIGRQSLVVSPLPNFLWITLWCVCAA